jgi:hypothetical protein
MTSIEPTVADSVGPAAVLEHTLNVVFHLTYHTLVHAKAGSKAKPKEKKETKTKELSHMFSPTAENYIAFLTSILAKHGDEKYKLTEKRRYAIKVLCPPAHTYVDYMFIIHLTTQLSRKADALDIDKFAEFQNLCKTICFVKPAKLTVYADMAEIEKALQQRTSKNASDDEEEEEEEDRFHGLTSQWQG